MNYSQFLKIYERHLAPMSSQNIRTRKQRRDYIEEQLFKMGYTFIIDESTKEVEQNTQKNIGYSINEPKTFFSRLINKYKKRNQKQIDYNNKEFIEYCIMFYGEEPQDMRKEDQEEAYMEFATYYQEDDYLDSKYTLPSGSSSYTPSSYTSAYYDPFVVNFYRSKDMKDNIIVFANGFDVNRPTRVLMAHYDVNTESDAHDNANDNGASIIVLLEFLEDRKFKNDRNVVVVFTDGEEFGGQGSDSFGKQIKKGIHGNVEWVLNLDVVGIGNKVIFEDIDNKLVSKIKSLFTENEIGFVRMPPNDAMYIRKYNTDAVCLSVMPDTYWDETKKELVGRPKIWGFLHTNKDKWNTIEKEALTLTFDAVNKIMNS